MGFNPSELGVLSVSSLEFVVPNTPEPCFCCRYLLLVPALRMLLANHLRTFSHTGAFGLLGQSSMQPQLVIGGSGCVSPQHAVSTKDTASQFLNPESQFDELNQQIHASEDMNRRCVDLRAIGYALVKSIILLQVHRV